MKWHIGEGSKNYSNLAHPEVPLPGMSVRVGDSDNMFAQLFLSFFMAITFVYFCSVIYRITVCPLVYCNDVSKNGE